MKNTRVCCLVLLVIGCGSEAGPKTDAAVLAADAAAPDAQIVTAADAAPGVDVGVDASADVAVSLDVAAPSDVAPVPPDAAPDAAAVVPDAAPQTPDVAPQMPDAMAMGPTPDAMVTPDAMTQQPDAGPAGCTPGVTVCPAGSFCSNLTRTCLASTGSLHFTFTDSCAAAGPSVGLRLFDVTHNGVWPSSTDVYVIPFATTKTIDISCIPGAQICFGANSTGGALFWGLGLNRDRTCAACCTTCAPPSNVQPQNLLCN